MKYKLTKGDVATLMMGGWWLHSLVRAVHSDMLGLEAYHAWVDRSWVEPWSLRGVVLYAFAVVFGVLLPAFAVLTAQSTDE